MPVVDVSSLFKDMSQAESKLFNKARDLFFVNERKQTKAAHSAELTNLLFELLDRELSPATVAEVTSMLVNTVQKLKDYAVTKKTLGILLVRNDISKPALANVYALAANLP